MPQEEQVWGVSIYEHPDPPEAGEQAAVVEMVALAPPLRVIEPHVAFDP